MGRSCINSRVGEDWGSDEVWSLWGTGKSAKLRGEIPAAGWVDRIAAYAGFSYYREADAPFLCQGAKGSTPTAHRLGTVDCGEDEDDSRSV